MQREVGTSWEGIYQECGILQREAMPVVSKLGEALLLLPREQLRILDSGCGTGRHALAIAQALHDKKKNFSIEAFDASQSGVEIVAQRLNEEPVLAEHIRLKVYDYDDGLPFLDDSCDAFISTLTIEHVDERGYALVQERCREMNRVLRPGGLLAFAVPATEDPRFTTGDSLSHKDQNTKINTIQKDGSIPHHFFTTDEIEKELFPGWTICYKQLQSRPSVTADVTAQHWEYLLRKP